LLDLTDTIAWEANDFRDLTHVNESGRIKWSNAVAAWLKSQL
jgi:lysophospholipase L1-like esterase